MGSVILITGASSGIGKVSALHLIKEGHTVYSAARRVDEMQELADAGGHVIKLDLADTSSIHACAERVMAEQGRLDVLWNNAGYGEYGPVEHIDVDDARRLFEVNVFGLAELSKFFIPVMREQGKGYIINTSSIGGKIYTPLGAWYHASKFALEGWTDALRFELKDTGIKVVSLQPASIRTEFGDLMIQPMRDRSKNTIYEPIAEGFYQKYLEIYDKKVVVDGSQLVAELVSNIIRSDKPKFSYPVGYNAGLTLFLRRILSDRLFDKVVDAMVKREK